MFRIAMEVAKRNDEKQLALDVLTRIPSVETLEIAVAYLDKPGLKNAAAPAAVKIAPKRGAGDAKAGAAAMQKVLDAGVRGNPGARATQLLDQAKSGSK